MSFLRSKNMQAYELIIAKETETSVVDHLGTWFNMQEEWLSCSSRKAK